LTGCGPGADGCGAGAGNGAADSDGCGASAIVAEGSGSVVNCQTPTAVTIVMMAITAIHPKRSGRRSTRRGGEVVLR
jgi:hypothetical protein